MLNLSIDKGIPWDCAWTQVAIPSRTVVEGLFGTDEPTDAYLIIYLPSDGVTELYSPNNLYAQQISISGQSVAANAGGYYSVDDEGDGKGAVVTLDGSRSGSANQITAYAWSEGSEILEGGTDATTYTGPFPDGRTNVTLTVTDKQGKQHSDVATVAVQPLLPEPPFGPADGFSKKPVGPHDPNAMDGPAGYGSASFVSDSGATLPYRIDFENSPTASARPRR